MVYDLQEQEQIDDLKAWWERYGGTVTVALILGLLVVAGIQGWRWYAGHRAESASVLYSAVSEAVRAKDSAKAKDAIAQLTDQYASTGYAPRAELLYARMLYDAGDRNGAKAALGWVVDHAAEDELKAIARYRLAQVQVDEKQYDAALATLDAKHPGSFDGIYADLRGDALAAAGRNADARAAYENALAKLDAKSAYRNYVQVKHDAIPVAPAVADAKAPAGAAAAAKPAGTQDAHAADAAKGAATPQPAPAPNASAVAEAAKPPPAAAASDAGPRKASGTAK